MSAVLPSVTACVPTYNSEHSVSETIASLQAQTYPNLRILICDDASTDATAELCRTAASVDRRVQVRVRTSNVGWVDNVNALLADADGEYVFIAAHDDVLDPRYVSSLVDALEHHPRCVLAYSDLLLVSSRGRRTIKRLRYADRLAGPLLRGAATLLQVGTWWIPYRGLIRHSALAACGGLRTSAAGEFSADWPWLLRLALRGPFVRVREVYCEKRLQKSSLSRSWDFSIRSWLAVDRECRAAIAESSLPKSKKVVLGCLSGLCVPRHVIGVAVTRVFESTGIGER